MLLVGLLFTFVSEVVGSSLERLGQSDRPVNAHGHLLVGGGTNLVALAASATAEARLETGLERLVVLAPEAARESRAQLRDDLDDAGAGLRVDLIFGDTAGDSGFELAAGERARAILLMPASSGPVLAEAADVEVTMIAPRENFDRYLGSEEPSGVPLRFVEARPTDPMHLPRSLVEAAPHIAIVTPSPASWDQRVSDASATLAVLHFLRTAGAKDLPVVAELFLPETARRLPRDPRLLANSGLRSVATAVALSLFDAPGAAELERQLAAGAADR